MLQHSTRESHLYCGYDVAVHGLEGDFRHARQLNLEVMNNASGCRRVSTIA